jgi:dihydroflavonol-4-reductase
VVAGPVLVTGATGVVGSPILRRLVESGRRVAALVRSAGSAQAVARAGAIAVEGDVLNHGSLVRAFSGFEVVYHVAGVNQFCVSDPEPMDTANIDGSRNVLRACAAAGVRRMVYTSSAAVIGEEEGMVGDEGSPHRGRFLSKYERSKYLAEQAVFAEQSPVEVVAVNPSSVQGPGRASGTGKLILQVIDGKLPVLVDTRVSMVDIDDCARGHLLAEERGKPGERYILNGFTLTIRQALDLLERVTGRYASVRFLPGSVALVAAGAFGAGARILGKHPKFCWEMARTMLHGHAYDGSKATRDLGLVYAPAEETLRRLYTWALEQGLVGPPPPAAASA